VPHLTRPSHAMLPYAALYASVQAFSAVTVKSTLIMSAETAAEEIDETLRLCLSHCLPVFIEIPSDIAAQVCAATDCVKYLA
jgi:TPP-dependent 2-oxoacid decarboxylase